MFSSNGVGISNGVSFLFSNIFSASSKSGTIEIFGSWTGVGGLGIGGSWTGVGGLGIGGSSTGVGGLGIGGSSTGVGGSFLLFNSKFTFPNIVLSGGTIIEFNGPNSETFLS